MLFFVEEIYDNYKSSFYVIINDNRQVNLAMKNDERCAVILSRFYAIQP